MSTDRGRCRGGRGLKMLRGSQVIVRSANLERAFFAPRLGIGVMGDMAIARTPGESEGAGATDVPSRAGLLFAKTEAEGATTRADGRRRVKSREGSEGVGRAATATARAQTSLGYANVEDRAGRKGKNATPRKSLSAA